LFSFVNSSPVTVNDLFVDVASLLRSTRELLEPGSKMITLARAVFAFRFSAACVTETFNVHPCLLVMPFFMTPAWL